MERAGKPIERIFTEDSETVFRELERATIADLVTFNDVVISTGAAP